MVVCAEAGLGLETAIDRVSVELRASSPAVAMEFNQLGQDIRLSSDRSAALLRMGERTGLDSFQQLAGTLSQTLRYGTPLGQALRVLGAEMRNERLHTSGGEGSETSGAANHSLGGVHLTLPVHRGGGAGRNQGVELSAPLATLVCIAVLLAKH